LIRVLTRILVRYGWERVSYNSSHTDASRPLFPQYSRPTECEFDARAEPLLLYSGLTTVSQAGQSAQRRVSPSLVSYLINSHASEICSPHSGHRPSSDASLFIPKGEGERVTTLPSEDALPSHLNLRRISPVWIRFSLPVDSPSFHICQR
jgi:hypothetical protein